MATPSSLIWSNGYIYRRTIAIDHTKVLNTDQVNFPVLISGAYPYLAGTANGGNVTSASGFDIIFTSDATGSHKARELPKEEFRQEVERQLTWQETEPWEIIYFTVHKSQLPVIE